LLEADGDQEGAIVAHKEAVHRKPDEVSFYTELADLLEKKGDLDGAMAQAREAIRIAPDNPGGHFVMAKTLRMKGDNEEAAKENEIATTLQAKNPIKRIRVGGLVMSAKLVHKVNPTYPREAKRAGAQGTVRLEAVIGKDGNVRNVRLLSGDSILAEAATEAVSKWRYQPTLIAGEPVEVVTEINVNFALAGN
jgi:TonB family protein